MNFKLAGIQQIQPLIFYVSFQSFLLFVLLHILLIIMLSLNHSQSSLKIRQFFIIMFDFLRHA